MTHRTVPSIRGEAEAFSLTEFVIVLMCATVLIAAAVPGIATLQSEWAVWSSARTLEAFLHWGRMHAISANTPVLLAVDDDRQTFYWTDPVTGDSYRGTTHRLPNKVLITGFPRRPLRFYQHGNAAPAGTYTVQGDRASYSVIVSPGGRIRIQKN